MQKNKKNKPQTKLHSYLLKCQKVIFHSHQSKYKIIKIYTVTERFCYCVFGYNYNKYIITISGFLKYFMTNSTGSSQCDPELPIPDKPFISGYR